MADYLANALNVPAARVHVEGRGSDQPVASGKDAASLAANRRVEIVIEGSRFEANAPLELAAAGGKAENIATQGVILRGPSTRARSARRAAPRPTTSSAWAWCSTSTRSSPASAGWRPPPTPRRRSR